VNTSSPPSVDAAAVAGNVARVRERIAAAAARAGRDPGEVTLVAVAKLFPPAAIRAAVAAGVADIGENYAQDLEAKAAVVPAVRWHFVGRLQRNKAGVLVRVGALVHSLDSLAGARAGGGAAPTPPGPPPARWCRSRSTSGRPPTASAPPTWRRS
jgi:uncharacterized pyridoxal phosphate-containing UPF0001 family protein